MVVRKVRTLLKRRALLLRIMLLLSNKQTYFMRRPRRIWVHEMWQKRKREGAFHSLMTKMRLHDPAMFRKFVRMSPPHFDYLTKLLDRYKKKPNGRPALSIGHRLAITLRYLASGDSLVSISFAFRVGFSTVQKIVHETCKAIWDVLQPIYLSSPTLQTWEKVTKQYETNWNFPFCLGAVDGKHVVIEAPNRSGSLYRNYKGTFSIVLMAAVDAEYNFIVVDIGGYGSHSDGGIFKASTLGRALENDSLQLPANAVLPQSDIIVPPVFVGDEAFQLRKNFMRPFPGDQLNNMQRIFNYRLSRARRCVENAFGILAAKWRIFRRPINLHPENIDNVVKACIVLHNFLRTEEAKLPNNQRAYCPPGFADHSDSFGNQIDGHWRQHLQMQPAQGLINLSPSAARHYSLQAAEVRMAYARYFSSSAGQVSWQWNIPGVVEFGTRPQ